jgi:hypothetical protein
MVNGWASYKNSTKLPPMRLDTLQKLKSLYDVGNKFKSKRISGDRAHAMVMEEIASEDWHEQLLVTVARVKAFFGYSKARQDALIHEATLRISDETSEFEGSEAAETFETFEDIEDAERQEAEALNARENSEAWDFSAADDQDSEEQEHEIESGGTE